MVDVPIAESQISSGACKLERIALKLISKYYPSGDSGIVFGQVRKRFAGIVLQPGLPKRTNLAGHRGSGLQVSVCSLVFLMLVRHVQP